MKPLRQFAVYICVSMLVSSPAIAQVSALDFSVERVPVGQVLHYVKSARDGTNRSDISVFVATEDRIEALKWDRGGARASFVVATMDWSRFSVRGFESWQLARGKPPERKATVDVVDGVLSLSLMSEPMSEPMAISHWPWHSYDFDFTSLNLILPHLRDPESALAFWRTDFVYEDPPRVAELGEVSLAFQGYEQRGGKRARRYTIGGAGLADHAGTWWADADTGLLIEYEIPVGDEPGYADVRFRLEGAEPMSPAQWESFKAASTAPIP
jgi:hypothetical protein